MASRPSTSWRCWTMPPKPPSPSVQATARWRECGESPRPRRKQAFDGQTLLKVDIKTIGRAIAALSSSVEHRGSKKTGGYYVRC